MDVPVAGQLLSVLCLLGKEGRDGEAMQTC